MNALRPSRRTFEQQRRWTQSVAALRNGWTKLLPGVAIFVGAGALALLLPVDPLLKGFIAGVLFASAVWAPFMMLTIRTYSATVGSWGESFTGELLRRERPAWPVVHDVPMERRNIDHVAVSPRAVLAIETKFLGAGSSWDTHPYRTRFLHDAQSSASSVRSLLRSRNVGIPLPVNAVLVLWGPGAPPEQHSWDEVDGVVVVAGRHGGQWVKDWSTGDISPEQGRAVKAKLEEYQAARRRRDRDMKRRQ